MKKLIVLAALMVSTLALSSEVVLVGPAATCKSQADVFKSIKGGVWQVVNSEVTIHQESIEYTGTVKLLVCIKDGDKFKFVVENDHMTRSYTQTGILTRKPYTMLRTDLKKEVIFYNEKAKILAEVELSDAVGEQSISVEMPRHAVSVNRFPRAASKGKYYFDFSMRTKSKFLINNEDVIGPMNIFSAAYRMYFNTEETEQE